MNNNNDLQLRILNDKLNLEQCLRSKAENELYYLKRLLRQKGLASLMEEVKVFMEKDGVKPFSVDVEKPSTLVENYERDDIMKDCQEGED